MNLAIVDYGVGNLGSVGRAFRRLGASSRLTSDPEEIRQAPFLVLPGVGHFGESMRNLRERTLEGPIRQALADGAKLLGICVGFQMLFETSEEAPGVEGLGLLPGVVKRFGEDLVVPHVGWNQLEELRQEPLLEGVAPGDSFYFLHSYYVAAGDESVVWASTAYGGRFCSVAGAGRVAGIQFHPEKSQRLGLKVLSNFLSS
jgi:imidazole glycerol phosphate synthase glutamine amidotransferase subunit